VLYEVRQAVHQRLRLAANPLLLLIVLRVLVTGQPILFNV
jgi:hypothetical protein